MITTFYDHSDFVNCVKFHPEGSLLASCSADCSIKVWDVRSSKLLQHYDAHNSEVTHVDFHPSGAFLISTSKDSSVKVWDLTAGNQMYTLHGHEEPTNCASFSPKGDFFTSTSEDALVLVWRTNFDKLLHEQSSKTVQTPRKSGKSKILVPAPRQKHPKPSKVKPEKHLTLSQHSGQARIMDSSNDAIPN